MTQTETITEKAVELEREGEKIVTDLAKKDGMSPRRIPMILSFSLTYHEECNADCTSGGYLGGIDQWLTSRYNG